MIDPTLNEELTRVWLGVAPDAMDGSDDPVELSETLMDVASSYLCGTPQGVWDCMTYVEKKALCLEIVSKYV